jgi:glycosyltransferase involved in cell wall biosynthesis
MAWQGEWEKPWIYKTFMRVMMVNTLYPPPQHGGAEKFVSLLAEGLVRAGLKVSIATLHPDEKETADVWNGVRVHRFPIDNIYWPFDSQIAPLLGSKLLWHGKDIWNKRAAARLGRIIDHEQPEVVHTHGLSGFSVATWSEVKKRRIRLVHTLHDFYLLCKNSALFRNGEPCRKRCTSCALATLPRRGPSSQVDAVVGVSRYVLNAHLQHGRFRGVPSSVVYNIVGINESEPDFSPARPNGEMIFGYIGRLEQEKGIHILLEACQLLRGKWRLRVAGLGKQPFVETLKMKFCDAKIEWLGFVDASSFYRSIDVLVVPSVWPEPMGRIVIEAFAHRRAVICSNSGGIPEVAAFGKRVKTYPATDVEALAAIMTEALMAAPRWREGGYRDEAARKLFSETYIVDRYREIYSKTPIPGTLP